jgi:hypothetical protein
VEPEAVNAIVKAIMSTHDGRTWKPETVVAAFAALAAAGAAIVTFILGKRQIASAQRIAQQQIESAEKGAQRQIASAQAVAQQQIESAQSVARTQLIMPMREAWIEKLREKIARYIATCTKIVVDARTSEDTDELLVIRGEILLMLNHREGEQAALFSALHALLGAARARPRNDGRFEQATKQVTRLAHDILRSEWQRATEGKEARNPGAFRPT